MKRPIGRKNKVVLGRCGGGRASYLSVKELKDEYYPILFRDHR